MGLQKPNESMQLVILTDWPWKHRKSRNAKDGIKSKKNTVRKNPVMCTAMMCVTDLLFLQVIDFILLNNSKPLQIILSNMQSVGLFVHQVSRSIYEH